jgi:CBS domain-containing protein
MRIGEICVRNVVCADRKTTVEEAAQLMRSRHVGDLIVVDSAARGPVPVGIITDRDIVVQIVAAGLQPSQLSLGDIIGGSLITASEDQGIFDTIQQMQHNGIRRLPVVDKQGVLLGIITTDDVLQFLAIQFRGLSNVAVRERRQEAEVRP